MRKKPGNPYEETPQVKPLVRGPRNEKEKGELAELAFLHKAASLGFGVAKPYGDSECYDFILDSGERFWRVQVKSIYSRFRRVYRAQAQHSNGRRYKVREIDFVVAYVVPRDIWYVVPVNCVAVKASMAFYPSGCRKRYGHLECYREAWHLMAPGDLKPLPGILRRVGTIDYHRKHFVE
jgi:hypothetical protein